MVTCRILPRFLTKLLFVVFFLITYLSWTVAFGKDDPTVVFAVGDIADCTTLGGIRGKIRRWYDTFTGEYKGGGQEQTAKLLDSNTGIIIGLGDFAYPDGSSRNYKNCFDPAWGRHKSRIRPTPGNHDYWTPRASGYFEYFGASAGPSFRGYYSFDLAEWHIISLNGNFKHIDLDEQISWLRADLVKTEARCILAFWHQPPFSSGRRGSAIETRVLFNVLYEAGTTIILSGHEHNYERHAPQDPQGRIDLERGIRVFVVGTGGGRVRTKDPGKQATNLEALISYQWGILKLVLHPTGYQWEFLPTDSASMRDKGSAGCVGRR